MDSETLAQLRHAIEHNVIDYEKHFGISNVSSRISNPLYGNGSVRIRSNPGNGTYVTIEFEQMEEISMKKIMIVDDNYLSAEGIEKNIDWETLKHRSSMSLQWNLCYRSHEKETGRSDHF